MEKIDKNLNSILIYGGTTEGRELAEELCKAGFSCTVCVATEYGERVMDSSVRPLSIRPLSIRQGRMDIAQMKQLMDSQPFFAVVDATHPFATEVSKHIKESLKGKTIPYIRLKRNTISCIEKNDFIFPDAESCVASLIKTKGNILLTTGSKDLSAFCTEELKKRLFVRVLPNIESLSLCETHGIYGKQIIAIQGPFSVEMNEALIKDFQIDILVTKESGAAGGFFEKIQAARNTGITIYRIGNPEKEEFGYSFEETITMLYTLADLPLPKKKQQISLIGMGVGREGLLTVEAKEALIQAEVVFGSSRMLQEVSKIKMPRLKETYPYYMAEDILNIIKEKYSTGTEQVQIAVLFSGDIAFYSGAKKLYEKLKEEKEWNYEVKLFAGISSISYLSAATGISLNDIKIASIHGRKTDIIKTISNNQKTFLFVSGVNDIRQLGSLLLQKGMSHLSFVIGYQLSYPEEEIKKISVFECKTLDKEGLYCCLIINEKEQNRKLTHGRKDESFIRATLPYHKVPMTKEEIREVSICKLDLKEDSILYDIGSGTGSIAVECALLSNEISVYAIEKKKEAVQLIKENCKKFGVCNVEIIEAAAPEGLSDLPVPSHVFIGGSSGAMREILWILYKKNPYLHLVINAITLETIGTITEILKEFPIEKEEVVQLQVNRSKKVGGYHLMQSENPVYILTFTFVPEKQEDICIYQES